MDNDTKSKLLEIYAKNYEDYNERETLYAFMDKIEDYIDKEYYINLRERIEEVLAPVVSIEYELGLNYKDCYEKLAISDRTLGLGYLVDNLLISAIDTEIDLNFENKFKSFSRSQALM
jgi:hypothetical protein